MIGAAVSWLAARFGHATGALVALAVAVALIAGQAYAMYRVGWGARDQQALNERGVADNDQLRRFLLVADASHAALGDYVLRRGAAAEQIRVIHHEVPRVTTVYRPAPAAPVQLLPQCVFTRGFVRLWDAASFAGGAVPAADSGSAAAAGGAIAGAQAAASSDIDASDVSQHDVLTNHIDNAAADAEVKHRGLSGAMPTRRRARAGNRFSRTAAH